MMCNDELPPEYKNGREDATFAPEPILPTAEPIMSATSRIEIFLGDEIVLRDPNG